MRSTLQEATDPRCPADPNGEGIHCAHIDTHDACCDCPWHIDAEGQLCDCAGGLEAHLKEDDL